MRACPMYNSTVIRFQRFSRSAHIPVLLHKPTADETV